MYIFGYEIKKVNTAKKITSDIEIIRLRGILRRWLDFHENPKFKNKQWIEKLIYDTNNMVNGIIEY